MSTLPVAEIIQANARTVRDEIRSACDRAGRPRESVRLIAVTKYADWPWVEALHQQHAAFGENRPQQLSERAPLLPNAEWHLIGQLQRNKVRTALQTADWIHSVDSLRLLTRVEQIAQELDCSPNILLQVNTSGEAAKSGFEADSLVELWPKLAGAVHRVRLSGLMTMAPVVDTPENARPFFRQLRELRDTINELNGPAEPVPAMKELSMGMSGDFSVAIGKAQPWFVSGAGCSKDSQGHDCW